ncbi:hypothetical protein [Treponema vincentii]|uniref:Uncharacterized protein n=1 Tax=Treponema vincentii F0403 TaxID=1125702 RepID=S3MBM3_9SPIR|nr:hypothetical protein [Treponema vincentii]EPF46429.1 hypothetical protein HMPREF1222_01951 [Treponema vincentii F0403]
MNEFFEIASRFAYAGGDVSFDVVEARKEIDADGVSYWTLKIAVQKTPEQLEKGNGGASDADNQ